MSDYAHRHEIRKQIDRIADRFEAAFRAGEAPKIEAFLPEIREDCRTPLFRELLTVELQLRQKHGETPQREEYQRRFPSCRPDIEVAFRLADDAQDSKQTVPIRDTTPPQSNGGRLAGRSAALLSGTPFAEEPGGRFGRFELVERLGSGGFGTVWKAYDTVLKRAVALKIPRADRLCPQGASLLLQEARNVAPLKHAGLALVYDVGEESGMPYIAREYIAGQSLREQLRCERLSCRRAAEICLGIAQAIHHAHEMGIVHRDLKPGNILLDEHGTAYVTDFGLAQINGQGTPAGEVVGTANYMAPEQAARRSEDIDRRTDVFAVGVILYEMLLAQRPFQGQGEELLTAIQIAEPVRPRKTNRMVPRDLEAICLRCLKKAPAGRYQTASDLAEDLQRFLQGDPVRARPLLVPLRLVRWARQRPAIATLAITSLLLLVTVVAVGAVSYVHTAGALQTTQIQLYLHRVVAAHLAWEVNDVREFERLLDECPPHLRGWEWGYLNGLRHSTTFVLSDAGGPVAFSPDGKLIATGGGSETDLKLWDAATGERLPNLGTHDGHISSVSFSPDGRWLVSAGGERGQTILWDVATRQKIGVFRGHTGPVHTARFLPDGKRVATASTDGSLRIWDVESQKEFCPPIRHGDLHVRSMAVCPDGKHVALATGSGRAAKVRVWDVESLELVWNVPAFERASGLAFSRDGKRLAVAAGRDLIRIWDVKSRTMIDGYPLVPVPGSDLAFSPDGTRVAATSWDNSVVLVDTAVGQSRLSFRGHEGQVRDLAFSKDGEMVAFGTNANRVYVHRTSSEPGTLSLRGHNGAVSGMAFLPGSARLVSAGEDGTVRLWDVVQGRELRLLIKQDSPVHCVCCSPDGETIAAVTKDGWLRTWNSDSGELLLEFPSDPGLFHDLTYDPSGTQLALVNGGSAVAFWDAKTGERGRIFAAECGPINKIAYSPCGRWLAIGARDRQVHVLDAQTLLLKQKFSLDSPVSGLAFGTGGILAVVAADGSANCWGAATGENLWTLAPEGVYRQADLSFHPKGTRLALAVGGEAVTLWDLSQKQRFLALRQDAKILGQAAFSSDGTYLASASGDGSILVWSSSVTGSDSGDGSQR